jgi:hypothetical protein
MALGMQTDLLVNEPRYSRQWVESWTTLANQMDRYEAVLQKPVGRISDYPEEAGKYHFRDGE